MQNVLVCDDEKDIVNALEIYLSSEDINVFKAYNGKEALDIIKENEIHLAIVDITGGTVDRDPSAVRQREHIYPGQKQPQTDWPRTGSWWARVYPVR